MPNINTNYLYTGAGPFDAKSLKNTYEELLLVATWTSSDSAFFAYNGMIVAVWKDPESTNNGIYYLFDPTYTGQRGKKPDVTNSANWHKISDKVDVSAIQRAIDSLQERVTILEERKEKLHTYGYRHLFPAPGEEGHMYVAEDLKRTYVWANNQYVLVGAGFEETDEGQLIIDGGDADIVDPTV